MQAERERTAGGRWFDLPAPQLTPELKNDLKLLRMRNALDPARHYKTTDSKTLPRYFQVSSILSYMLPNTSQLISYTPAEHEAAVNNDCIIYTLIYTAGGSCGEWTCRFLL